MREKARIIALAQLIPAFLAAGVLYTYDSAGRLVKADYGSAGVVTYTYDVAGNLVTRTMNAASSASPVITLVANAEGETPSIAPNTWVEIKGTNLAPVGDTRIWQASDFANNQLPAQLDGVSVTVNGKSAFVYYISPTQVNILTPPDAMQASVPVKLTTGGVTSAVFTVQTQQLSPSFFVFNGGPYAAAVHLDGTYVGPATLYPGLSTPAKPGETILLFANGFGSTTVPVVSGSLIQSGPLETLPVLKIGGLTAVVSFAGLVAPGEFQFNVIVPATAGDGDNLLTVAYNGQGAQAGVLLAVHH
jgi:uncharacterized protein (TIGR03437 family)